MATATESVAEICASAKRASRTLATLGSDVKDAALEAIADALVERTPEILEANARDLEAGREAGLSSALLDRLALDPERIAAIADGARKIAALPDPVGEVIDGFRLPNGLDVRKVRVPLGVVAVVYEAQAQRHDRCGGPVPEVGERDRAARLEFGGALQRRARRRRRGGSGRGRPAGRFARADRRRRSRRADGARDAERDAST